MTQIYECATSKNKCYYENNLCGSFIICDQACENRPSMWALKIWLIFKLLALITFNSNMVRPQNFQNLLKIYLALQNFLQNPNITFQYWDMSHQMTLYILAHMPYFRRLGHILWKVQNLGFGATLCWGLVKTIAMVQ